MKNSAFKFISFLFISLFIFSCKENSPVEAESNWENDINYFAQELPLLHPNLFFKLSQQEFNNDIENLKKICNDIPEYEVIVRLHEILIKIGDSHTRISGINPADMFDLFNLYSALRYNFHRLPLQLYWFSDGVYIIAATSEYSNLIGKKINGIGNSSFNNLSEVLKKYVFHDNDSYFYFALPFVIACPEFLKVAGIINDLENVEVDVEGIGKINIASSFVIEEFNWTYSFTNPPLYLKSLGKFYSYTYLEEEKILFIHYNLCMEMPGDPFSVFESEVIDHINNKEIDKLIFDIRMNLGGSALLADNLINNIKNNSEINLSDKFFVIIGRRTFSSGLQNAQKLKHETNATLLGEPTSGSPVHYGEVKSFKLPYSNLTISHSTKYFNSYYPENTPGLNPEIYVELSSEDFFNNIDPVYNFIIDNY